ncbi:MAG: ABC transporter ATP-binding protein [Amphiplicatus sp.]
MLVAENLTRRYGDFTAVDDVSFTIGEGEIVGLLGHNGAGKTTIMKMLTGYIEPTAGRVLIDGRDVEEDLDLAQAKIGYLPENAPLYPDMTVLDYLHYAAELRCAPKDGRNKAIRAVIEATDLFEKAGEPIAALSRGLRQRVGVAQAILTKPKIVILDEPTGGLDPSQIRQMRDLIKRLAESATVILSTHILQEVQAVCKRAIIINRGRIAYDAPLSELQGGDRLRLVSTLDESAAKAAVARLVVYGVERVSSENGASTYEISVNGADPDKIAPEAARAVIGAGGDLIALYPVKRDLEALFADISSGGREGTESRHV